MESFRDSPANSGWRVVSIVQLEKLIRSAVPPSLMKRPRPMVELRITQLLTRMLRKSLGDSVPILTAVAIDSSTQFVTTMSSHGRPSRVLHTIQSSPATIQQLELRTRRQETGS